MVRTFFALSVLCLCSCAFGQTTDLQQILSGKEFPNTLKVKDLTPEWRHVSIAMTGQASSGGDAMKNLMQMGMMSQMGKPGGGGNDAAGAMAAMSMLGGLFGGGQESAPSYYTQGKTTDIRSS